MIAPPYIHENPDWPAFRWKADTLFPLLADVRHKQGRLLGRMETMGFALRQEAALNVFSQDVLKSSEIEGENLDPEQVRSSVARRLGLNVSALAPADRHTDGVVETVMDATQNYDKPLTKRRLYRWHAALFLTGQSGLQRIRTAAWRDDSNGPMQVVSGPLGHERVHYEAPAASRIEKEMALFLDWFETKDSTDPVLRAGLAHLWFVTIHPFEDGNGRIARAIADMALARAEKTSSRFYSLSSQIRKDRKAYYDVLEDSQKGTMDATEWLVWFLGCLGKSIENAHDLLGRVLEKARFWKKCETLALHERQRLLINKLLDGFEGKMTSSKWAKIAKCSQDTALRDIQALLDAGLIRKEKSGGRSTSYTLITE